jgi:hypothetical protein
VSNVGIFDAPTSHDPRAHYDALLRSAPGLVRCPVTAMWVAVDRGTIDQVLQAPDLFVRPSDCPVPSLIANSPFGDFFGSIVRQRDDQPRDKLKSAIERDIASWPDVQIEEAAELAVSKWSDRADSGQVALYPIACSVEPIARLLGFQAADLDQVVADVMSLTRAISPAATASDIIDCAPLERLRTALSDAALRVSLPETWVAAEPSVARDNAINLMVQANDAGAGLIGAALLDSEVPVPVDPEREPPIHNTRRFAHWSVQIGSTQVAPGEAIVVVLAGPSKPDDRRPFGNGRHACPGKRLAQITARVAIEAARGKDWRCRLDQSSPLRALGNARIRSLRIVPEYP